MVLFTQKPVMPQLHNFAIKGEMQSFRGNWVLFSS